MAWPLHAEKAILEIQTQSTHTHRTHIVIGRLNRQLWCGVDRPIQLEDN